MLKEVQELILALSSLSSLSTWLGRLHNLFCISNFHDELRSDKINSFLRQSCRLRALLLCLLSWTAIVGTILRLVCCLRVTIVTAWVLSRWASSWPLQVVSPGTLDRFLLLRGHLLHLCFRNWFRSWGIETGNVLSRQTLVNTTTPVFKSFLFAHLLHLFWEVVCLQVVQHVHCIAWTQPWVSQTIQIR